VCREGADGSPADALLWTAQLWKVKQASVQLSDSRMIGPQTRGRGERENMSSSLSNGGGGEGEVCLDTGGVGSGMEGGGGGDEGGCITSECITSEEEGCKGGEAGGDVKVRDLWRVLQMKNFAPQ